jgi:hypothetical protein
MRALFYIACLVLSVVALDACNAPSSASAIPSDVATETSGPVLTAQASTDTKTDGSPTVESGVLSVSVTEVVLNTAVPTVVASPTAEPPSPTVEPSPTVQPPSPTVPPPTATKSLPVATPPQLTATSGPVPPNGPRTVTIDDAGKTIDLKVGDSFLLALGDAFEWNVTIADPSIVSRQVNILVVRGAQGVYNAHKVGRTTLQAVGDPPCRKTKPPCGMPSRAIEITLVVH